MRKTLNSAADVPLVNINALTQCAGAFLPPLQAAFPWLTVTPKLHAHVNHAPAFLRRFGSLGAYGMQALESWHGFFKVSQARCTADSLLGECKRHVERSAFECRTGSSLALADGQLRKSARSAGHD